GSSPEQIRTAMYQYGPTAGHIRDIIADSLRVDENIDVPAESIVVAVGAQEAMILVLRALIAGPDDVLLASSPCYVASPARLPRGSQVSPKPGRFAAAAVARRPTGGVREPAAPGVGPRHSHRSGPTPTVPSAQWVPSGRRDRWRYGRSEARRRSRPT